MQSVNPSGPGNHRRRRRRRDRRRYASKSFSAIVIGGSAGLLITGVAFGAPITRSVVQGKQIYECNTGDDGVQKFNQKNVDAELEGGIKHDFVEDGKGPARFTSPDGSEVTGKKREEAPSPNGPDNIPELKLDAKDNGQPGELSGTREIRRENTEGGKAPAGKCEKGEVAEVDYKADYTFDDQDTKKDDEKAPEPDEGKAPEAEPDEGKAPEVEPDEGKAPDEQPEQDDPQNDGGQPQVESDGGQPQVESDGGQPQVESDGGGQPQDDGGDGGDGGGDGGGGDDD
jgi:hypothetical protein